MEPSEEKNGLAGWLVFVITGAILGAFGAHGFSAKNHNGFFIALLLISVGIVLFFGTFCARD